MNESVKQYETVIFAAAVATQICAALTFILRCKIQRQSLEEMTLIGLLNS